MNKGLFITLVLCLIALLSFALNFPLKQSIKENKFPIYERHILNGDTILIQIR